MVVATTPEGEEGSWTTTLCGCPENWPICCWTTWCPCIQIGRNIEIISEGEVECFTAGAIWYIVALATGCLGSGFYACLYRKKLRKTYRIPGDTFGDLVAHLPCCAACATCQEGRELLNRGWDPAIGYERNAQNPKFLPEALAPVQEDPMAR
eukprot:TRINITY_DN16860_c0_g1_i1.p1 TRINITY_DN16860_c0_g1~~TRINITY_DN16860_c0_g1_i1.p1  ORF type:complete len:152 (+),score=14.60 TRINITY_DN16860_c0_g1_i1:171-626(+)